MQQAMPTSAYALALLLSVLWGGNYVAIKVGVTHVPPVGAAGLRFLLGMVAVFSWARFRRSRLGIAEGEWFFILTNTLILFIQISLLNIGTKWTTGANTTVFMSTYPVFVAVAAHFINKGDRLNLRRLIGLGLSLAGIFAVFQDQLRVDFATLFGDTLVLASALLLGFKIAYVKRCLAHITMERLLFYQALFAVPLFAAASLIVEWNGWVESLEAAGPKELTAAALAIAYQGLVIAGFCFLGWTWLLSRYQASRIAAFTFITPLGGLVLSHWMLGDHLGLGLWLGCLLVGGGVTLATTGEDRGQ